MTVQTQRDILITHPNGQTSHILLNHFTDPWRTPETIFIQHGFCRTNAHWYHWVHALSRHYRVVRRSLRGHGRSSYPSDASSYDYTLDTNLSEILDCFDQLGLSKVHFLGESTSGMLGEALAARHSERIQTLTICSSPTHLPPAAFEFFAFRRRDWPTACRELGSKGWAEALSHAPGTLASRNDEYVKWWIKEVAVSDGEGLAGYADFLSRLDGRPFLKDIKVPTLILAPKNSAVMSVQQMEEVAATINRSRLVIVDVPGHEIYVLGAQQCQDALLTFLHEFNVNSVE
ncbi:alpha/beta-hydrolase [Plenodomus tracheiphilus IPT5]|uniref:Alpha/beta-hydrolase n=1 Tax=Plenodomus tracheiphilus IPT5 TaxID=1408161 RepID=A0A6A7B6G3_9PLEO|nr:alpha/beta-hydrolase [Plenodomus tracheiphilus IPT5]